MEDSAWLRGFGKACRITADALGLLGSWALGLLGSWVLRFDCLGLLGLELMAQRSGSFDSFDTLVSGAKKGWMILTSTCSSSQFRGRKQNLVR